MIRHAKREAREVPFESWSEFIEHAWMMSPGEFIYRGQSDSGWGLRSAADRRTTVDPARDRYEPTALDALQREDPTKFMHDVDQAGRLTRFRRYAATIPGVDLRHLDDEEREDEIWALGRHFGLDTPLLDWTRSPFVAAYFAFDDHVERKRQGQDPLPERIAIWRLQYSDAATATTTGTPEFFPDRLQVVEVVHDQGRRQQAQQGLYTKLKEPGPRCVEVCLTDPANALKGDPLLDKITIPTSECWDALTSLQLMNITHGTLFPDLEGAAREANRGDLAPKVSEIRFWKSVGDSRQEVLKRLKGEVPKAIVDRIYDSPLFRERQK